MHQTLIRTLLISAIGLSITGCGHEEEENSSNNSEFAITGVALNDTGVTTCANGTSNGEACPVATYPNQDAEFGRDSTAYDDPNIDGDADGHAGFSFTKLSSTGAALSASTTDWDCVRDEITGLVWEVKNQVVENDNDVNNLIYVTNNVTTNLEVDLDQDGVTNEDESRYSVTPSRNLQANTNTYTWYDSDKNSVLDGYTNGGICLGIDSCDTESYIKAINDLGLCNFSDWRLPSREELRSIVDYSASPTVDSNYFPNTRNSDTLSFPNSDWYWTSQSYAGYEDYAWGVNFNNGGDGREYKYAPQLIRLVRSN